MTIISEVLVLKKIALFGAGTIAKNALEYLGKGLVDFCFANGKQQDTLDGIPVLSFEEFLPRRNDVYIVVASTDYADEMCTQLEKNNIYDYLVWDRKIIEMFAPDILFTFPRYSPVYSGEDWSMRPYTLIRSFFHFDLSAYHNIILYVYPETADLLLRCMKTIGKLDDVLAVIHHGEVAKRMMTVLKHQADCVVCGVRRNDDEIYDLYEYDDKITAIDLFDIAPFLPQFHSPKVRQYKNAFAGKRCFLIGNGPSLRAEDLAVLDEHKEITFACNKIYKIFDQTKWRPDFYFITDVWVLRNATKEILNLTPKKLSFYHYGFCNGTILYNDEDTIIPLYFMPGYAEAHCRPKFSRDISIQSWNGSGVAYTMLEVAYYLGFSEIYMLGFDHWEKPLSELERLGHFYDDKNDPSYKLIPEYVKIDNQIRLNNSFQSARLAFEADERKIYNVTRGGCLEIFERVNFDSLF